MKLLSNLHKGGHGRNNKPSKQGTLIWPQNSLALSHFLFSFLFLVGEEAHQHSLRVSKVVCFLPPLALRP
jgi:hypothetical protein